MGCGARGAHAHGLVWRGRWGGVGGPVADGDPVVWGAGARAGLGGGGFWGGGDGREGARRAVVTEEVGEGEDGGFVFGAETEERVQVGGFDGSEDGGEFAQLVEVLGGVGGGVGCVAGVGVEQRGDSGGELGTMRVVHAGDLLHRDVEGGGDEVDLLLDPVPDRDTGSGVGIKVTRRWLGCVEV